ncbi:hypothetical protein PHLCEN_2v7837 [Hermanssonia centrifuga]|uniref:Uncharacterized protein n=1 Tax=Hermanssonia centrifuga TaxID=98765 RepID=A0A2R6NVN2_9APHY|nr:hypothetical protein PHLCEN_2v7837 [Hermanssonia centrifuga]
MQDDLFGNDGDVPSVFERSVSQLPKELVVKSSCWARMEATRMQRQTLDQERWRNADRKTRVPSTLSIPESAGRQAWGCPGGRVVLTIEVIRRRAAGRDGNGQESSKLWWKPRTRGMDPKDGFKNRK